MSKFEDALEEISFYTLSGSLNRADRCSFAAMAVVSQLTEENLGLLARQTIVMLLGDLSENIQEAIQLKDELMKLHAPDQIIPRPAGYASSIP